MTDTSSNSTTQAQIQEIKRVFALQQEHQYAVGRSTASERIAKLRRFFQVLMEHEQEIESAMWQDLRKPKAEVQITELGVIGGELRHTIKHLRSWLTPKSVGTPLSLFGASSAIHYEPKGVCLIVSPWNFPFNLTFSPLISAIAAGNTAIIKPSELTPNSAEVMAKIVRKAFSPEEVSLFQGDAAVAQTLTALPFNHIFFTGSPQLGKIVMYAAAQNLTSVTLELGGKSPVIVDETADLESAASSIAWLKSMNAGQICISPDYLLVQESVKDQLIGKIQQKLKAYYGETPEQREKSPDYCRIVNHKHYDRLSGLMEDALKHDAKVVFGGRCLREDKYIEPTVLDMIADEARIWEEEIFGPLLPVRTFKTLDEVVHYVNKRPKPLSLYVFSKKQKNISRVVEEVRCGGITVNDCGPHFYNCNLPFGGSNNSGIGKTHGEFGFREFCNEKAVLTQTRFLPTSSFMKPPYKNKIVELFGKLVVRYL